MKKNQVLDAASIATSCPDVSKIISVKSIVIAVVLALLSVGMVYASTWIEDEGSPLGVLLLTLGVAGLIWAICQALFKSRELVYLPTRSRLTEDSCYFDSDDLDVVRIALETASLGDLKHIEFKPGGNARVDFMRSEDGRFVAVQVLHYVPYIFEPVSEVVYLQEENARTFLQYLSK